MTIKFEFPMYDTNGTVDEQEHKFFEEVNELIRELKMKDVPVSRLFHEAQDVVQALISLSISVAKEQFPGDEGETLRERVEPFLLEHNALHVKKLKRYAKKRGWKKI